MVPCPLLGYLQEAHRILGSCLGCFCLLCDPSHLASLSLLTPGRLWKWSGVEHA